MLLSNDFCKSIWGKSFLVWTHHYQMQMQQILHTYMTLLTKSWLHILINHKLLSPYYSIEAESPYTYLFLKHTMTAKSMINTWQEMTYYIVILTGYNPYYPIYAISVVVTSIEALQLQLCMHAFFMLTHNLWLDHFNIWWRVEIMKIITTQYSQFLGTSTKQLQNVAIRFVTCLSVCTEWLRSQWADFQELLFIHSIVCLTTGPQTLPKQVTLRFLLKPVNYSYV